MIEKLQKPIRFDKDVDVLVVARDGEKFFVSGSDPSLDLPLTEMKIRPLLEWAVIVNYPIRKFVRAQRVLSAKFLGT
jgi:hypothetical protein